ncbi:MAG: hypothetical protein EU532_12540 [Promethearchaeota archaeon]|nr:MAG: hypothetical protein EU532_12540 [Candidatus Lokiarchaeota archaeon]
MNLLSLIFIIILYFYGTILLYITSISKKKGEMQAFYNNLINSLVLIGSVTISVLNIYVLRISTTDFIIFPFDLLIIASLIIYLPIFSFFVHREKNKYKDQNSSWEKYYLTTFKELPSKFELYRKSTHLIVLGIVFFYFTLGFLVQNVFVYLFRLAPPFFSDLFFSIYNLEGDKMVFTQYLVVFLVGLSLIGLISADIIRILRPDWYPLKPVNMILREKERSSRIGPHISMGVGCFSIIITYGPFQPIGPLIICTSMTMSIFGDMTANLLGRILGKKKIRTSNKTYEGLIAGMISAYISGFLCLFLLNAIYHISVMGLFFVPLVGSIVIGILDYADLEIDDNLSYNVLVSFSFFLVSNALLYQ